MRLLLVDRGPLLLTALAAAWGMLALGLGVMADARWLSILWASLERIFLALAAVSAVVAVALMVWRSMPRGPARMTHLLRFAPGVAAVVAAAYWLAGSITDHRIGLVALGGTLSMLIPLDRRLPPRA